tara:strand:- start:441 stop:644 length:204 start_codon:yes stop_codon:yes gene_type:complete
MLFGALLFAGGMLAGIRLYKHGQEPFLDFTPITAPTDDEDTVVVDTESIDWNVAEDYIKNLGDPDDE